MGGKLLQGREGRESRQEAVGGRKPKAELPVQEHKVVTKQQRTNI